MGRLIAEEHVKELLLGLDSLPWEEEVGDIVRLMPSVDAVPVVHGRWTPVKYDVHCSCGKTYETYHYKCSVCNRISYSQPYGLDYCPNCGAKMDLEGV